ncbi:DUF4262 domain-containing protein [Agrobacterium salinitolerans]|nr:DUF4262 domain-containing protein [Agrobacterium salinitolerans]
MDRKTLKEKEREANRLIKKYGFFVQHVVEGLSDVSVPYSFTSGLSYASEEPSPEFVMAGIDLPTMGTLLNYAVAAFKSGDLVLDGAGYYGRLIHGFNVGIVPVRPHTSPSRLLLPEEAEAYLIVVPDPNGLFPWEVGCDPDYVAQVAGFDCIELPHPRTAPPPSLSRH